MADLKFRIVPGRSAGGVTFELLSEGDEALLTGSDFDDRDACIAAIQSVIESIDDEERFAIRLAQDAPADSGGQILELSAPDGRALARSRPLATPAAATGLRDTLVESSSDQEEYTIDLPGTAATGAAMTVLPFLAAARLSTADLYDFEQLSSSGAAGFESFQNPRNGRFYFHFNDAQGLALLYSRGFSTASMRNRRMRAVMTCAVLEQRYERREEDGRYFFILKARNGQEIARSRSFASAPEREAGLAWLLLEMPRHVEDKPRRAGSRKQTMNRYNLGLATAAGAAGFELLRDPTDRLYYFLFRADDGQPLLLSQGYQAAGGRDHAVRALIRLGANPARYEVAEAEGRHYFVIRAGNRQEIARSRDFATAEEAVAAMALAQARLPTWAATFGVAEELLETARGERLTLHVERDGEQDDEAPVAAALGAAALGTAAGGTVLAGPAPPVPAPPASPAPAPPAAPARSVGSRRPWWPIPLAVGAAACLILLLRGCPGTTTPDASPENGAARSVAQAPEPAPAEGRPAPAPDGEKGGGTTSEKGGGTTGSAALPPGEPARPTPSRQAQNVSGNVSAPDKITTPPTEPAGAASPAGHIHGEEDDVPAARAAVKSPAALRRALRPGSMETALASFLGGSARRGPRTFTLDRLAYPPNSHEMNPSGKEQVYLLGQVLSAFPNARIAIHGNIDGRERERYIGPNPYRGYTLSKLRADCVFRRLRHQGVSPARMRILGDGDSRPVADDATKQGRQWNRRVEIVVVRR